MRNIENISLRDLVPESIRSDPRVSDAIDSLDAEIQAVSVLCRVPSILARIDQLDSATLDHLAWQFNAKTWRGSWPESLKRTVLRAIIEVKSRLGTRYAVEQAISGLGSIATIKEWWEYSPVKTAHTFDVVVAVNDFDGEVPGAEIQEDVISLINESKPVRSQFDFTLAQQARGDMAFFGAARTITYYRVRFDEAI